MTRWNSLPKKIQDKYKTKKPVKENGRDELIIPGELPTENEIIDKAKIHWAVYSRMKKTYTSLVAYYAEKQHIPFFEAVELEITYYRKDRRYDPDNFSAGGRKMLLDGLIQAGVLKNDGWKEIKGFKESWEVDKKDPRTKVILSEAE